MIMSPVILSLLLSVLAAGAGYPTHGNGSLVYIEKDSRFYEIECDKPNMSLDRNNNRQMCYCNGGYYLKTGIKMGNTYVTAQCAVCSDCVYVKDRPHQAQGCGNYTDTVCCPHPGMTVHETDNGLLDCVWPATPTPTLKNSNTVLPTTTANDKSPAILEDLGSRLAKETDCNKPDMIRHTRSDGSRVCYCDDGYHLHLGNILDLETVSCRRCSDCRELPEPSHQTQACGKYSDTMCGAASPDMKSDTSPSSPPPTTNVTDGMIGCDHSNMTVRVDKDGKQSCICGDGMPAMKNGSQFICNITTIEPDKTDKPKEEEELSETSLIMIFVVVFIAVMVLLGVICWCNKERLQRSCRSNNENPEEEDNVSLSSISDLKSPKPDDESETTPLGDPTRDP